jgi:7-dehydrocholesterol reductase
MKFSDIVNTVLCLIVFFFTPQMTFILYIASKKYNYELQTFAFEVFTGKINYWTILKGTVIEIVTDDNYSKISYTALFIALWYLWQALFMLYYPGKKCNGMLTTAGNVLPYNINGLQAWFVSHVLFLFLSCGPVQFFKPGFLFDYWGQVLLLTNIIGYVLAFASYLKACISPTNSDCVFTGNIVYDLFLGVELNPRIGDFDLKLFFNGRPGIVAWSLINMSFAFKQYEIHGYITNGMFITNFLQAVYIVDFFVHEEWYLNTVDIIHDRFGFYLAWGDSAWLPFTYTLQAYYLVGHPVTLPDWIAVSLMMIGLLGYYIFRTANNQKDNFRKGLITEIWGKKITYIDAEYTTNKIQRNTKLLTSGFWKLSKHFNYVGDLMMCCGFCFSCGFDHIFGYHYLIYMSILLFHRSHRDDVKCSEKYGNAWKEYHRQVPYYIFPYIY